MPKAAHHDAGWRGERRTAGVLEGLSRGQNRLLADHAAATDLLDPAKGIGDAPMPRHELHGLPTLVLDGDVVGPDEMAFLRRGLILQENGLYLEPRFRASFGCTCRFASSFVAAPARQQTQSLYYAQLNLRLGLKHPTNLRRNF